MMARPKKMIEEKRLNVKLEGSKHEQFRIACEASGETMSSVIEDYIDRYIQAYLPTETTKKPRSSRAAAATATRD
ncbi:hypothetical protein D3C75_494870 [compost metagenome]|jgi:hypothetical protein